MRSPAAGGRPKPAKTSSKGVSSSGWQPRLSRDRKGPVRSAPTPETTGDLMSKVLARLGGEGRGLEFRVFESYQQAVGEMLRLRTQPEQLRGKTLVVRVKSSALAHELTMLKGEIVARMQAVLGPDVVTDLRTRVGTVGPVET